MNEPIGSKHQAEIEAMLAKSAPAKRRWMRWALLLALAGTLAAGLVWWLYPTGGSIVRYRTEVAARGDLVVLVTATGSVQPITKVDVSSELSGTIRKVLVDFNSPVTAGQVLAELDTDKLRATLDSSRARLASAKARVVDARASLVEKERDLARKRTLATKNFTSAANLDIARSAYDRAVAALAVAEAEVGVAQADLTLNETNLAKAKIVSPIGGVVLQRNVDPGQTVAASLQAPVLFSIAEDLKKMELQVNVDEADVGNVRPGQGATFTVDAYAGRRFPATIRDLRYASETVQGVVTYKAVLDVDNSELLLRPGMTATAEIKATEIADALLVANQALRYTPPSEQSQPRQSLLRQLLPLPGIPRTRTPRTRDAGAQGEQTLWVLRDGVPAPVKVRTGASDGKNTVILAGEVKPGDQIVIGQSTRTSAGASGNGSRAARAGEQGGAERAGERRRGERQGGAP